VKSLHSGQMLNVLGSKQKFDITVDFVIVLIFVVVTVEGYIPVVSTSGLFWQTTFGPHWLMLVPSMITERCTAGASGGSVVVVSDGTATESA
jgi:hypothetical protein